MKKKLIIIASVVCCIALAATGTIAYFTAEDTAQNRITTGDVAIEVEELDADGDPFVDVIDVMPGDSVTKIAQVRNTGSNAVWVRVSVELAIELAEGIEGTPDTSLVTLDYNTTDWTLGTDGYYYYNSILEPGEVTEPLFTTVTFDLEDMGNMYMNATAVIDVYAYATQAANNGATVFEAQGWPEP
ncbi:MAG: TasA family protein [Clostridia bacterium]|nr:TasA family protein [Clostridia bacterium]